MGYSDGSSIRAEEPKSLDSIEELIFNLNTVDENIGDLIETRKKLIARVSAQLNQANEHLAKSHAWYESRVQGYSSPEEAMEDTPSPNHFVIPRPNYG